MAESGSLLSFRIWWVLSRLSPPKPDLLCLPQQPDGPAQRLTRRVRDGFNHATDRPQPGRSHRQWGTLPSGTKFEISLPVEILPDSVLGGRSQ